MPVEVSNVSLILGMGAVLVALVLIMLIVLVRFMNSVKQAMAPQAVLSELPVQAPFRAQARGNELIAVISAAVAMYMDEASPGTPYKVISVKPVRTRIPAGVVPRSAWASAGLRQNTEPF